MGDKNLVFQKAGIRHKYWLSKLNYELNFTDSGYIKRHLLNDIWDLMPEFFCTMVKQSGSLVTNSSFCLEDEVFFLCGKYMDSLKVVCTMGGER